MRTSSRHGPQAYHDENVIPFAKREKGGGGGTDKAKKKFRDIKDGVRVVFSEDDRMSLRSKQFRILLLDRYLSHANPEAFDETGLLVSWFGLDGSAKTAKSPRKLPITKRGLVNANNDLMAFEYLELIAAGGFGRRHTNLVRVKIPGSKRATHEQIERCRQIAAENGWVPGKGERRGSEKVNGTPKKGERYSPKDSTENAPYGGSPTGGPASRRTAKAGASVQEPPYGGPQESEDPGYGLGDQYSQDREIPESDHLDHAATSNRPRNRPSPSLTVSAPGGDGADAERERRATWQQGKLAHWAHKGRTALAQGRSEEVLRAALVCRECRTVLVSAPFEKFDTLEQEAKFFRDVEEMECPDCHARNPALEGIEPDIGTSDFSLSLDEFENDEVPY